ncbi:helix-turn-helix domain-containing protein [Cellulosimicrobium sp. XJ-DQ-B-000]|uniref:TetR/AcrR family transcriptional regulator n=1 Tax=Cellulosimicrobium sp. XJ-DQ-B-000 TaxID=3072182 RepID=UPI00280732D9|nr:helix-turn-helix domain-containing protein [Cellulosimicrobium sp. XJ-DQ-B-000]MDQ8042630.1 helix-turn-helix domain-containing protein [Cellulosimicrobium sp. XJ-DQ-B-000]
MQERRRTNAERTRATRVALVAAARDLFVRAGYSATSTPQIAAAANVTRGALYHHYADKQDLFRAVAEAEAEAVAREIEERTAGDPGTAAAERPDAPDNPDGPDAPDAPDARAMLVEGARAYLDAMGEPGRTRLLLVDAPAVLGPAEADALDARHARRTLREGLGAALGIRSSGVSTSRGAGDDDVPGPGDGSAVRPGEGSAVHPGERSAVDQGEPSDVARDLADEERLDALTLLLSAAFDRAALALDAGAPPGPVRAAVTELVDRVCAPTPGPRPRA